MLQERVDRLESLNPVKEQLQNATAMVEAQRNRTRSGLDVAAELTNKLQETLTAVGSDLREVKSRRVSELSCVCMCLAPVAKPAVAHASFSYTSHAQ